MKVGEWVLSHPETQEFILKDRNKFEFGYFKRTNNNQLIFCPAYDRHVIFTKGLNKIWKAKVIKADDSNKSENVLTIDTEHHSVLSEFIRSFPVRIVDNGDSLQLAPKN